MNPVTEQELQSTSVAPRITPADVEANIAGEFYFTAADGVYSATGVIAVSMPKFCKPLSMLTFCVLVLRNGFTVTGESACASQENFDAETGRRMARENAIAEIWPLMGYELKTLLSKA